MRVWLLAKEQGLQDGRLFKLFEKPILVGFWWLKDVGRCWKCIYNVPADLWVPEYIINVDLPPAPLQNPQAQDMGNHAATKTYQTMLSFCWEPLQYGIVFEKKVWEAFYNVTENGVHQKKPAFLCVLYWSCYIMFQKKLLGSPIFRTWHPPRPSPCHLAYHPLSASPSAIPKDKPNKPLGS